MIAQLDRTYVRRRPWKALIRLLGYALFEGRPITTRGRWINPVVFGVLGLASRLPVSPPAGPPAYIVGTGRSGTTVLGKILSLHPDVAYLNEPKALWHHVYAYEDVIGNYSLGEARYRLGPRQASEAVVAAARSIYGVYSRLAGARRVLDKYPEMIFRVPFVMEIFPHARFIFLVRDGWDTLRSIDKWSDRLGEEMGGQRHDWWGVDDRKWRLLVRDVVSGDPELGALAESLYGMDRHTDRAAVEWTVTMREGQRWMREREDAFHLLRYEALVTDPRAILAGLLAFCGLERDEAVLDYAEEILRVVPRKPPVELHPDVEPIFLSMMNEMGYER